MKLFVRNAVAAVVAAALAVGLSSCGDVTTGTPMANSTEIGQYTLIEDLSSNDPKTVVTTFAVMANDLIATVGIKPLNWKYFQNLSELERYATGTTKESQESPIFAAMLVTETNADAKKSLPLAAMTTGMVLISYIELREAYEMGEGDHQWTLNQSACYGGVNVTHLSDRTGIDYTEDDHSAIVDSLGFMGDEIFIDELMRAYETGRSNNSLAICNEMHGPR